MARLYHPTYTRAIPTDARVVKRKDGQRVARWVGRGGAPMEGLVSPKNPARCVVEVDCWWVEYQDHTGKRAYEQAFPDEQRSRQRLLEIVARERAIRAGDVTPAAANRGTKTVGDLIEEWLAALADKDTSAKEINQLRTRVNGIREEINARRPVDFTGPAVMKALRRLRETRKRFSPQTSNHYLKHCKGFTAWCVRSGYLDADPLRDATPVECDSRRTFERRALTPAEFRALLDAAAKRDGARSRMRPTDRVALYVIAAYTGFRVNEISRLTRSSFQLDGPAPTVSLPGSATKNKKPAVQPIPTDAAATLREWLAALPPGETVWPDQNWWHVIKALWRDMAAAGIPRKTAAGVVDMHALRTTYATWLALAGVPVQHLQKLMRHGQITTTMKFYARLGLSDVAGEIVRLPRLNG